MRITVVFKSLPASELAIMPYNRVVKNLHGLDEKGFVAALEKEYDVAECADGEVKTPGRFKFYLGKKWRLAVPRFDVSKLGVIDALDASMLQQHVLAPLLGIGDPRTDENIAFVGGIRGLGELKRRVDNGEMKVAFALYPVSMKQIIDIADTGNIMPPKTTWFEPKLRSGLVIHELV